MTLIIPTVLSALPTPPTIADPVNFDARADAKVAADVVLVTQMNAQIGVMYNNALEGFNAATALVNDAASAAASAASAAASAGATIWVSGTTYSLGAQKYSPTNLRVYRRTVAGAGTTDPSLDTANWAPVSTARPVVTVLSPVAKAVSNTDYELVSPASRTNFLLRSREFDNAVWFKSQVTATANALAGPDGSVTADTIVVTTPSGAGNTYFYQEYVTANHANKPFAFSVWLKSGTFNGSLRMILYDGSFNVLATNALVTLSAAWALYTVSGTFEVAPAANIRVGLVLDNGLAAQTLHISDAQLEEGLVGTLPSLVTTSATVTEGVRKNLMLYSDNFGNAAWEKVQLGVTSDNVLGPDGVTLADTLSVSVVSGGSTYMTQAYGTASHASTTFTGSIDIKLGTFSGSVILFIQDGSYGSSSQVILAPSSSEWLRYSITATFGATPAANARLLLVLGGGSVGQTVHVANAQLELGANSTSHILNTATLGSSGCCVLLPLSPAIGDEVGVGVANGGLTNVIGRSNKTIDGIADDLALDMDRAAPTLKWTGTTWRIQK